LPGREGGPLPDRGEGRASFARTYAMNRATSFAVGARRARTDLLRMSRRLSVSDEPFSLPEREIILAIAVAMCRVESPQLGCFLSQASTWYGRHSATSTRLWCFARSWAIVWERRDVVGLMRPFASSSHRSAGSGTVSLARGAPPCPIVAFIPASSTQACCSVSPILTILPPAFVHEPSRPALCHGLACRPIDVILRGAMGKRCPICCRYSADRGKQARNGGPRTPTSIRAAGPSVNATRMTIHPGIASENRFSCKNPVWRVRLAAFSRWNDQSKGGGQP
jgi:hypothetical protein